MIEHDPGFSWRIYRHLERKGQGNERDAWLTVPICIPRTLNNARGDTENEAEGQRPEQDTGKMHALTRNQWTTQSCRAGARNTCGDRGRGGRSNLHRKNLMPRKMPCRTF